jgi:thioredoxin 1
MVKIVTQADFGKEVNQSPVPVLLDFYADWCPPCRALGPELEKLDALAGGKIKILKVNVDDVAGGGEIAKLMQSRGIRGIPALLLIDRGNVVAQSTGYQSAAQLQKWVEKSVNISLGGPAAGGSAKPSGPALG